jgi:hypothetical protein
MKKGILLLCLLGLAVAAYPAAAATAQFQANCAPGIPTNCVFDPLRPSGSGSACPGSSISRYFWDFGDGTSVFITPPPNQTGHTYSSGISTDVCLTVFCANGTSATTCHCFSNVVGIGGCIRPIGDWTP